MNTPTQLHQTSQRLFLLLFLLCTGIMTAQEETGSIRGKIYTSDGQSAAFVNIIVENTNKGTISDENGNYQIKSISAGQHIITFSLLGMEQHSVDITVQEGRETRVGDVTLNVSTEELQEVVLEAKRLNKFDQKQTEYVARMPLSNLENPQVYSVITGELLEELQVTDIQSTLQATPGISNVMQGIGSGGVGVNLYLRGFSVDIASRNGMNSAFRASTDQANIERIEVIKGPSGTLFGTSIVSSYGGVVNLVTKKPYETFGGSVGYLTGSNNLSRLTMDINTPLNKAETVLFRLNAAKHNEHSFQDYGLTRNWFAAPSILFKASDRLTLSAEAEIFTTHAPSIYFNMGGAGIGTMDDLDYDFSHSYGSDYLQNENRSFNFFAQAKYKVSDSWTSQTLLASSNVDNGTNYLFLDFYDDQGAARRIMNIESQFYVTQVQQNFIGEFELAGLKNKVVLGADYYDLKTPYRRTQVVYDSISADSPQMDFNPKKYESALAGTNAFLVGTRNQHSINFYASDVLNVTDRLFLMTGIRLDNYNDVENDYSQSYLSPKVGLVYQPVKDKISVFGNYMNGFQNVAPDLSSGEVVKLKPEKAIQWEGGLKAHFLDGKLNTTISYYDIKVKDAVRYVNTGGTWSQVQDGVKSSKGIELEIIANPVQGWNIVAGYANNTSEFVEGDLSILGNTPYGAPETTLNLWSSYRLPKGILEGLGLGFGLNHVSESFVDDANTLSVPSYSILSGSVFLDRPSYRIGLKFNNFTNEEYWATMGSYVQPQKTSNTVVSLAYKF